MRKRKLLLSSSLWKPIRASICHPQINFKPSQLPRRCCTTTKIGDWFPGLRLLSSLFRFTRHFLEDIDATYVAGSNDAGFCPEKISLLCCKRFSLPLAEKELENHLSIEQDVKYAPGSLLHMREREKNHFIRHLSLSLFRPHHSRVPCWKGKFNFMGQEIDGRHLAPRESQKGG